MNPALMAVEWRLFSRTIPLVIYSPPDGNVVDIISISLVKLVLLGVAREIA